MNKAILVISLAGIQALYASQLSDNIISSAAQGLVTAGTATYLHSQGIQPEVVAASPYVGNGVYMGGQTIPETSYSAQNNQSGKQDFLKQYAGN